MSALSLNSLLALLCVGLGRGLLLGGLRRLRLDGELTHGGLRGGHLGTLRLLGELNGGLHRLLVLDLDGDLLVEGSVGIQNVLDSAVQALLNGEVSINMR